MQTAEPAQSPAHARLEQNQNLHLQSHFWQRLYNFGGREWTAPSGPGMSARASPVIQWNAGLDKLINKITHKHAASPPSFPI